MKDSKRRDPFITKPVGSFKGPEPPRPVGLRKSSNN